MIKDPHWPKVLGYKPIDLGLVRIKKLMQRLGSPHLKLPPVVHVAGTNGKGSTIALMRAVLEDAGYKVHVYTSPHLIEFNERIVLAGKKISDDFLYEVLEECRLKSKGIKLTFFEGTTAAAFLAFSKVEADIVLLETGMGGRLDATNIVPNPIMNIITSISFDHMEYLGNTLVKIAKEKAAIIKKNAVCITSISQEKNVMQVIKKKAEEECANLIIAPRETKYKTNLIGEHQKQNVAVAVSALKSLKGFKITEKNIKSGLMKADWPARMQEIKSGKLVKLIPDNCELWLDGGHNEGAVRELIKNLKKWRSQSRSQKKKLYLIFGLQSKRDCKELLNLIPRKYISQIYGVKIPGEDNSYDAEQISMIAEDVGFESYAARNVRDAIKKISENAKQPFCIIIFGSLYLAGSVLAENE